MPGKYIPPHLRPNYNPIKLNKPKVEVVKRRGVHFKSNTTMLRSQNEKWHRYTVNEKNITRSEKAAIQSKKLTRRVLRKTPHIKSALKKPGKETRKILSLNLKYKKHKKRTLKSI
jgi:hypothetical protein